MSSLEPQWERRRWHAPQEHGGHIAVPAIAEMPQVVRDNRLQADHWSAQILGTPLSELRRLAREEILAAAARYSRRVPVADMDVPLIVGGHQPEWFHVGVWAKNFLLDGLARATNGMGLHLIVDHDLLDSTRVAVPAGSRERPRLELVPFDADQEAAPWEEVVLRDESVFRDFADRVSATLVPWNIEPILSTLWPSVTQLVSTDCAVRKLSDLVTHTRREAERRLGIENLELPFSHVCQTRAFAWFVSWLLLEARTLRSIYNDVVRAYRTIYHVRSSQHPWPDLAGDSSSTEKGRLEMPFWVWRNSDRRRGRLFIQRRAADIVLSNESDELARVSWPEGGHLPSLVDQVQTHISGGLKIRPRALTTTLFARLFLADAFVHGLGGAKYDEMTDRLIAQFCGFTAPPYLMLTATAHLPIEPWPDSSRESALLRHRLWDFDHNPERHVSFQAVNPAGSAEAERLLAEKQQLIDEQREVDVRRSNVPARFSKSHNFARCLRLRAINRRLSALASEARQRLQADAEQIAARLAANQILRSREFAFCLHPEQSLRSLLDSIRRPLT